METEKNKKKKRFLNLPEYPGGKKALQDFINQNLKYPTEALEHQIEGDVFLRFEVSDSGEVLNALVASGIGYGCDEEALRIVCMLRFSKPTNRGVRVKTAKRMKIKFRLNQVKEQTQITYTYKSAEPKVKAETQKPKPTNKTSYSYTIQY